MHIGDKCTISDNFIENYGEEYRGVELEVIHVATSVREHPGYDTALEQKLYDFRNFPWSLYDYEVEQCQ